MELERPSSQSIRPEIPARAVGAIQGAGDVQVTNANISVVGGDSHSHVHYHGTTKDLKSILDVVCNFRKIQQDTLVKATPGTVEWLFKAKYFTVWWNGNGDTKILWGSGIPGAGKTILASLVIDEAENRLIDPPAKVCVAYFYMRYSENGEVTVRTVLEVLVKQSLERHENLLQFAEQTYARHIREGTQPTEVQLLALLQKFIAHMAITLYILDALDEAPIDIQHDLIEKLASLDARIFITSRPMQDVQSYFPEAHCFEIVVQDRDLDLHIAKKLQSSPRLRPMLDREQASVREQVVSTVKSKCGGMFLHASLQLDALGRCLNVHSVMETLKRFPAKIEDVYTQTWERILNQDPDHAALAKMALIWVLYAKRPLTIKELRQAIATCPQTYSFKEERRVAESTITDLCFGLLSVDKESQLVRLVHYTAKQPLERLLHIPFPHPHSLLAAVCIARLTDCGLQNSTIASEAELLTTLDADLLLHYAYNAWSFHAEKSLALGFIARRMSMFITGCCAFPVALDHHDDPFSSLDYLTPLHIVAFYNFPVAFAGPYNASRTNIQTKQLKIAPLPPACRRGHDVAAQTLLRLPNILVNVWDRSGATALILACRYGHVGITKLLLAHTDINVNQSNNRGDTSLIVAARKGYEGIVELLLAHPSISVNWVNARGDTALISASSEGHDGVVRLLLADAHIKINLASSNGDVPLILAASTKSNSTLVEHLLAHPDIEVNLTNKDGVTALMAASREGCDSNVALLLTCPGIDVNLAPKGGDTALLLASIHGRESTVKLLLAHPNAKFHQVNDFGYTVLMCASQNGHESLVRYLLGQPGIDVNWAGKDGLTALMLATQGCHIAIVELLLAHPAIEANSADNRGDTPLIVATRKRHEWIFKRLLSYPNINVNSANHNGDTPLLLAAFARNDDIFFKLLLDHPDTDVNLPDEDGDTPLINVCREGYENIVMLLLAHPAILVNLQNNRQTALIAASLWHGNGRIVELLLAHPNIEVNMPGQYDDTALMVASFKGHKPIVELLLAAPGIDVNRVNRDGDTALIMSTDNGHDAIVRMLLEVPRINTSARSTSDGNTALSIAVAKGHHAVVKLLQDFELRNIALYSFRRGPPSRTRVLVGEDA